MSRLCIGCSSIGRCCLCSRPLVRGPRRYDEVLLHEFWGRSVRSLVAPAVSDERTAAVVSRLTTRLRPRTVKVNSR